LHQQASDPDLALRIPANLQICTLQGNLLHLSNHKRCAGKSDMNLRERQSRHTLGIQQPHAAQCQLRHPAVAADFNGIHLQIQTTALLHLLQQPRPQHIGSRHNHKMQGAPQQTDSQPQQSQRSYHPAAHQRAVGAPGAGQ
jgi:hypothetical protein